MNQEQEPDPVVRRQERCMDSGGAVGHPSEHHDVASAPGPLLNDEDYEGL